MSSPSPLIPQGALTPPGGGGSSNVRLIVIGVVVVHVVFFGGLLFQGCSPKEKEKPAAGGTDGVSSNRLAFPSPPSSNSMFINEVGALPPPSGATGALPADVTYSGSGTRVSTSPPPGGAGPSVNKGSELVSAGPAEIKEYAIVAGDNMYNIAKKEGISMQDLVKLNPSVDPKKMRPGMKILIPPPKPQAALAEPALPAGGGTIYVVKPNDNLGKIASMHGVTVKELRAANNLKTTRIDINQKLVIPQKAAGAAAP